MILYYQIKKVTLTRLKKIMILWNMNFYEMSCLCVALDALDDATLDATLRANPSYFSYAVAKGRLQASWVDYVQQVPIATLNQCKEGVPAKVWIEAAKYRPELSVFIGVNDIWNDATLPLNKKLGLLKKYILFHRNIKGFTSEMWATINTKNKWDTFLMWQHSAWNKWSVLERDIFQKDFWKAVNDYHIVPSKSFGDILFRGFYNVNIYNRDYFVKKIESLPVDERIRVLQGEDRFVEYMTHFPQEEINALFLAKSVSGWGHDSFLYKYLPTLTIPWEVMEQEFTRMEKESDFKDNLITLLYILHLEEDEWRAAQQLSQYKIDLLYPLQYVLQSAPHITDLIFPEEIYQTITKFRSLQFNNIEFFNVFSTLKKNIKGYVPSHWFPKQPQIDVHLDEGTLFLD